MQRAAAVATLFVATVVLAGCSGSTGPSLPAPMVDRVAGTTTADAAEAPDPERAREPVVPASATADGSQVPTVTTPTATPTAPQPSTGTQTSNETVTESSTARSQPSVGDGVQSVSRLTPPLTAEVCLVERRQGGLAGDEVKED